MGPGLDRRAPLFLASTFNKLASLECLIRHGADLRTTNEECSGATCLSVAAERNNALVIRALAAPRALPCSRSCMMVPRRCTWRALT